MNIMISSGVPYWIDFGMVGRITEANINAIQNLIFAIVQEDVEGLTNAALALGTVKGKLNKSRLMDDLETIISKYMSAGNLEDIDVGYRARIRGYENRYIPAAVVYHAGSATSGSAYNEFKVIHSSRNSVYLIYKNMPALQVVINIPFLLIGYLIKIAFFARRGFLKQYLTGLRNGIRMSKKEDKVVFQSQYLKNYLRIQLELWWNVVRRFRN